MSLDREEHLLDTNCAHLLGFLGLLDEDLLVQVVAIVADEVLRLGHEHHDVDALIKLVGWEMAGHDGDAELLLGERAHLLVCAVVVGGERGHLVEDRAQVLLDFVAHVDLLLKKIEIVHPGVLGQVLDPLLEWIDLVEVWNHDLVDLVAQLVLGQLADRGDHCFGEGIIDLFFVVVDGGLGVLEVLDVVEHVKRVAKRHQEVVHLVESLAIGDDLIEENREQSTVPVQEAATSRFAHHDLPAADHLELLVPVCYFIKLACRENISINQVDALLDHGLPKCVIAALVALDDVHHELKHVVLNVARLHGVYLLHAALDLPQDELARVAIDQDNPLID